MIKCPNCTSELYKAKLTNNEQQHQGCFTCSKCNMPWYILPLKRKANFVTTIIVDRKTVKTTLSGIWNGTYFVHVNDKGYKTVVRNKSWLNF